MMDRIKRLAEWYFSRSAAPYWVVLIMDCVIVLFAGIVGCYVAYGGDVLAHNFWHIVQTYLIFMPGYLVGFRLFHTYSGIVRYSSSVDLMRIASAMGFGTLVAACIHYVLDRVGYFNTDVRYLSLLLSFLFCTMASMLVRLIVKQMYDSILYTSNRVKVFVYGVHEGGEAIARSIISDKNSPYVLSGFVADEPSMKHHTLMGIKVYLNDESLMDVMRAKRVKTLFVSPLRNEALRENTRFLNDLVKNRIRIMVQSSEMEWDGKSDIGAAQLKDVEIEDLLPRDKIEVDLVAIGNLLKGKSVLVTGAAGSIGSEMVRQIATFKPSQMVLVDAAETPMHDVRLFMANNHPDIPCETVVSSISNKTKMESLFKTYKPEYVFHAAAYKHVPMMENNPSEAVQNNIYGTRVMADLAVIYGAKKFVMISTDKAVNPTNVMGCSKRICEIYCQALNKAIVDGTVKQFEQFKNVENPQTQFVTTRFGNVLGSNGSVIPLFRKQIQKGGPVTVTHPDIIRFFMLIPEACRLVLEAGTMGNGGEIFVFDMGKPVRIADLAQRMIDLSGAKNVEIKFTGLRDGEKLFEEVLNDAEQTKPTMHPKIMVAQVREYEYALAEKNEEELLQLSYTYDDMAIVGKMKEIVPEYKSQHSKYEALDK
ncbi:MAG: polysaccharide biosynthesis protein [Prevotella sp.]|nr:polysaccharide biosynthesis protein [Candidatus Prevotella equi]